MYLVQNMLSLLEDGSKPHNRAALVQVGLLSRWEQAATLFRHVLDDYQLFSFDVSALIPASDIRTDSERGLLAIASHVTKKPRRLFIECGQDDLERTMPEFDFGYIEDLQDRPKHYGIVKRRGCLLDILGNGRCVIQTINRLQLNYDRRDLLKAGLSPAEAKFVMDVTSLQPSSVQIQVDMAKDLELNRADFVSTLPADLTQKQVEIRWAQYQVDERFWAETSDTALNTEYAGELNPLEAHMVEVIGIFQAGIAMAAVLELKDAEQAPRSVSLQRKAGGRTKKRSQTSTLAADVSGKRSISVVTMRLNKEILISLRNPEDRPVGSRVPKETGSRRALHYVRGHMFLARNGQIVYRKPHFRGQAGVRTLHRVVG
ncbi:hypothetical protein EYC08_13845 [Tabrizicola sp. WMC-M-20]|nr:hypothetical protein EYC08_13845 [Tabrizicola sp. WMC-M-20]